MNNGFPMKNLLTTLLCGGVLLLALPSLVLAQQTGEISGTVTEAESGDPLPGATVQIPALGVGSATSATGEYTIEDVPTGEQTLEVSFVGYESVERRVTVGAGETVTADFELQPSAAELDEVVVTGVSVGTSTQKLGFSVAKIDEAELQAVPGTNPADALRAKTPGARVVQASGQPGTAPSIRLRGTTTLSGSQEPLVVIDGAITGGGLEDVDMQSVQSIEIIKGAAAASLYGSLAGNGVIQIITKDGSEQEAGQTRVTVRNEFGFTQLANEIDLSEHHARAARDANDNPITGPDVGGGAFRSECSAPPCDPNPEAPDLIQNNDFDRTFNQQDVVYDPRAFFTNYLSVSSNQGGTNYLLSFENTQNNGVVSSIEPYTRRNVRLNVQNQISDRIQLSASTLYSQSSGVDIDEQGQGADNLFYGALLAFPDLDLDAPAPDSLDAEFNPFSASGNAANPLYRASAIERETDDTRLFGSFKVDVEATDWLTIDGQFSWDDDRGNFRQYTPKGTFPATPAEPTDPGFLLNYETRQRVTVAQGRALFSQEFGELSTSVTASYTFEDRLFDNLGINGSNILASGIPRFNNVIEDQLAIGDGGARDEADAAGGRNEDFEATIRSEDFVGNIVLDYRDRYILDAVLRQERVSLFGPDARDATYFRLAGTYRLTEDFEIPYVQGLKLRGSFGTSGSRPPFEAQYETFTVTQSGIRKDRLGNRSIEPANVFEYELGLDATFLDRFYFEGTYSAANAENQVLEVPLSSAAGFTTQFQNAATLETSTFEFAAGGQILQRDDWGLEFGVVFDRTRQEVTQLNRPAFNQNIGSAIDIFRIQEGVDLGVMFGNKLATGIGDLRFGGDGCLIGEQSALSDTDACLERGDLTVNDDGYVIEAGTQYSQNEEPFYIRGEDGTRVTTEIGNSNPDFNVGLNTTLRYRNLSLYTALDVEYGADIYNYTRQLLYFNDRHGDLDQTDLPEDRQRPKTYYTGPLYNQASPSSHFVEDGTYLKVREIALTYRITSNLIDRIGLGNTVYDAKVSILGRNLFTFTDYSGFDPEVSTEVADQPANYKFDEFAYPQFRTFSAALELRF